jgi:hypothetical protein
MVMPTVQTIESAIEAIEADGGDATLPTQILDQDGYTIAVVQRTPAGTVAVTVPDSPTRSVAGVVQSVTGFLDKVAGTLTNIATQLQKTGNAVKGGAAGASAGYNAPTDLTPYLIGGLVLLGVGMLASSSRGRR